jgi:CRP-like cAMP-binding protein
MARRAPVPHSKNRILSGIRPADLRVLQPHLRLVELEHGLVIAHSRQRVHQVYFPHGGILSCIGELKSGFAIETGMIGNDGVFGAIQAIDDRLSLNKVIIQVPSQSSVADAAVVKHLADSSPDFRRLIIKYEQFLLGQVQQTTACNALHSVEERMCTWLVRMYDLVGRDLPLTQEFLAQMMGVQRTSVSGVASGLQEEGLIDYHRGKVRIVSIDGVQRRACECHESVREQYLDIFGKVAVETFPEASDLYRRSDAE